LPLATWTTTAAPTWSQQHNGSLRVILNRMGSAKPWLGLRLLWQADAYGATVEIRRQGSDTLASVRADGSYLSANDPRILVAWATRLRSRVSRCTGRMAAAKPSGAALRQYTTLSERGLKDPKNEDGAALDARRASG